VGARHNGRRPLGTKGLAAVTLAFAVLLASRDQECRPRNPVAGLSGSPGSVPPAAVTISVPHRAASQ